MSPLAVGPVIALLGILAAFFVLRGRARSRKSMYRTLRETREHDLKRARERAAAAKLAAEKAAIDKENAERAAAEKAVADAAAASAAASAATAPEPTSTATIPLETAPTYTPPPAKPEPAYQPPPAPEPEPAPVEVEPAPEPPPAAAAPGGKAGWEIVEPAKRDAMGAGTGAAASGSNRASWELDTAEREKVEARHRAASGDQEGDEDVAEESPLANILGYAGLVAALLLVLIGILFMIGAKAT